MARVRRKPQTTRSEHWLRVAVNEYTHALDTRIRRALSLPGDEEIEWLSPVCGDDYAEYYDQEFLDRLEIKKIRTELRDFWPSRGPQWDGLARSKSGKYVLVEAKAYADEARTHCTAKALSSLVRISESFKQAKVFYGADPGAAWETPYYQYANRLAHLYFMRALNDLDAYLLFLNFADAPDVSTPCSPEQWVQETSIIKKALGLPQTPIEGVATIVWSVASMRAGN